MDIPIQIQEVVNRALAKDPNDRYQSAGEFAKAFLESIGMHAEAETLYTPQSQTPEAGSVPRKRNPARTPILIGAGVFACVCLGVIALTATGVFSMTSLIPRLISPVPSTQLTNTSQSSPEPTAEADGYLPVTDSESVGVLRFQNGVALMDKITISATLDLPPENMQYEAWLIDDDGESSRSVGVLERNDQQQFTLTYVDAQSQNLLSQYNRMEITLEPNLDDNPNSTRDVVYSSFLSFGSLDHIRHLIDGTDETPNEIAVAVGLLNNMTLIKQATDAMVKAHDAGDRAGAQVNAETIVNLIVGSDEVTYYNDWNGDGTISDPGDGYGLLINGGQAGYLDGMIHHSSYAADAKNATEGIQLHATHIEICIQNLETWAPELRDLAVNIARATENQDIESDIRTASILADHMLNGVDINGNESIDHIAGEGGALTAIEHTEYMSDMQIFPGENQEP